MVSQRRNSVQVVQLFGSADAHRSEVADVAIVAVVGRHISVFELTRARQRHHYVICVLRAMHAIVVIQLIPLLESTAVNA